MTKARKGAAAAAGATGLARAAANPHRGEHELVLGGQTFALRPSYGAQVAIEQRTGLSYTDLARAGHTGALRIEHAAIIAAEFVNAGAGDDPLAKVNAERMGELIYEEGFPLVAAKLTIAIIDSLSGGRTSTGEAKAAAA